MIAPPVINVGDMISDSISPVLGTGSAFQLISQVVTSTNSKTGKQIFTCTVPSGTVVADQDYAVLSHSTITQDFWVMSSPSNENSATGGE